MSRLSLIALALLAAGCAHRGHVDEGGDVVPANLEIKKLQGDFVFTEGPAADPAGNVYFTDQKIAADSVPQIWKWSAEVGSISVFMEGATGRANGMSFDRDGYLIACADEKAEMWKIDTKDKSHEVLFGTYGGKELNSCNDVWVRLDGGIYFTDPYYQRTWWTKRQATQDMQAVYFWSPKTKQLTRVISDFQQPNGIIGTPDGKTLYVADIRARTTWAFDIQPDGSLANKRKFCDSGSDGMTIDNRGNVYLTSNRSVLVFDPTGKQIGAIAPPEAPANVCFGGKDMHTLFMTARTGFYSARLPVFGVDSQ